MPMTIQEAKQNALSILSQTSPSPALDVECLLSHITGRDKTWLLFNNKTELTEAQRDALEKAVALRKTGLPVAYITGSKEFFGYSFYVTPSVLIPKPDTELLVEQGLNSIRQKLHSLQNKTGVLPLLTICDMCTGSGCVGLSILKTLAEEDHLSAEQLPLCFLVDLSQDALEIARKNADTLLNAAQRTRVRFIRSNLFEQVRGSFDVIVTNPPYIPARDIPGLLADGRREPVLALNGDVTEWGEPSETSDGLALIRRLVPQAYGMLNRGGHLLMETGEYNAERAASILDLNGFTHIRIEKDLAGDLRDVCGVKK